MPRGSNPWIGTTQLWPGLEHAPPTSSLAVNIPLVDVSLDNGALEVWPGTHVDLRPAERFPKSLLVLNDWLEARRTSAT